LAAAQAAAMLRDGEFTIEVIAARTGYASAAAFTKASSAPSGPPGRVPPYGST